MHKWFQSLLSARSQKIQVRDFISISFNAPFGAPQASNLEPISFNLYINHISNAIQINNSRMLVLADDIKIFIKSSHNFSVFQRDIDVLLQRTPTQL